MDNQYTPTYHRMWNRDFSMLIVAELLLCIACYMTVPFIPLRLLQNGFMDAQMASLTMVLFVVGIGLSGFFNSWLIQRYRRNRVFTLSAMCLAATILSLSLFDNLRSEQANQDQTIALMSVCAFGGFVFGQAKRVLSCTLLIDKTESCHRTEANYAAIWIARLMVVAGPVAALLLRHEVQTNLFYGIGAATALVSAILVMAVKFPFRAPEEGVSIISTDRFFLSQGWSVAIVILLMSAAFGIVISTHASIEFFSSLIAGFFIAIVILHYAVIRKGKYTSAVGNVCMIAALVAMTLHNGLLDDTLKPMALGLGFGLTSSEQLYKLLDRCNHCQRSTAESTYFMASDGGLFLGIATGWCGSGLIANPIAHGERAAIVLLVAATAMCCLNAILKKKHIEYHA